MELSAFAVPYMQTVGRTYYEPEDPTRTPFQRDRDRIIHAKAFRRLSGKTQVFTAKYTDHTRDRLTHSLEVAQVARDVARMLKINEDLCEAIALAHDLGHTPFGHAGQDVLNKEMERYGFSFEHNEQSRRIVEVLENPFPHFSGLNLTREVLDGLAKHQTLYDQKTKKIFGKTIEAQVVDKADEIAYHTHDLDDGIRLGLFTFTELRSLNIVRSALERVQAIYNLDPEKIGSRVVSMCMHIMINDLAITTQHHIERRHIISTDDVKEQKENCVTFSEISERNLEELRDFLWKQMYQSPYVLAMSARGQHVIKSLFHHFFAHPNMLPDNYRSKIAAPDPLPVIIKDYIAGMTDAFAIEQMRLHSLAMSE